MEAAAIVAAVLIGFTAAFQLALAAGTPWGDAVYNGVWSGVLPKGIRINNLVFGALIYPLMIFYVLDAGAVLESGWLAGTSAAIWVIVGFFAVLTVTNVISDSKLQRWIWSPVTAAIVISTLIVALG